MKSFMLTAMLLCGVLAEAVPVRGHVVGPDGKPVPFNVVTVAGQRIACEADENGFFEIDLPEGSHELIIHGLGFKAYSQQVKVSDHGMKMVIFMEALEGMDESPDSRFLRFRMNRLRDYLKESKEPAQMLFPAIS